MAPQDFSSSYHYSKFHSRSQEELSKMKWEKDYTNAIEDVVDISDEEISTQLIDEKKLAAEASRQAEQVSYSMGLKDLNAIGDEQKVWTSSSIPTYTSNTTTDWSSGTGYTFTAQTSDSSPSPAPLTDQAKSGSTGVEPDDFISATDNSEFDALGADVFDNDSFGDGDDLFGDGDDPFGDDEDPFNDEGELPGQEEGFAEGFIPPAPPVKAFSSKAIHKSGWDPDGNFLSKQSGKVQFPPLPPSKRRARQEDPVIISDPAAMLVRVLGESEHNSLTDSQIRRALKPRIELRGEAYVDVIVELLEKRIICPQQNQPGEYKLTPRGSSTYCRLNGADDIFIDEPF